MLDANFKLFDLNIGNITINININRDSSSAVKKDKDLEHLERQMKKNKFPDAVDLKRSAYAIYTVCEALVQKDVNRLKNYDFVADLFSRARRNTYSFEAYIVATVFYEGTVYTTESDLEEYYGGFHYWYKNEMPWDNNKVITQKVNRKSWHQCGIDVSALVDICNRMKLYKKTVKIGDYKDTVAYPYKR